MKKLFFIIFALQFNIAQSQNKTIFNIGEKMKYKISYKSINVGFAEIEITDQAVFMHNRPIHVIGKGSTNSFFDLFFKVRDIYETYIDTSLMLPVSFNRKIHEGGFTLQQNYYFLHEENKVLFNDSVYKSAEKSQDMLSVLFYVRQLDFNQLKNKKHFSVPVFMDEENYSLVINYTNSENISNVLGITKCVVLQPKMQKGRIFNEEEKMLVWISDDTKKIPIKVEAHTWAGILKADLISYNRKK